MHRTNVWYGSVTLVSVVWGIVIFIVMRSVVVENKQQQQIQQNHQVHKIHQVHKMTDFLTKTTRKKEEKLPETSSLIVRDRNVFYVEIKNENNKTSHFHFLFQDIVAIFECFCKKDFFITFVDILSHVLFSGIECCCHHPHHFDGSETRRGGNFEKEDVKKQEKKWICMPLLFIELEKHNYQSCLESMRFFMNVRNHTKLSKRWNQEVFLSNIIDDEGEETKKKPINTTCNPREIKTISTKTYFLTIFHFLEEEKA